MYAIELGVSFGNLPDEDRERWLGMRCDGIVCVLLLVPHGPPPPNTRHSSKRGIWSRLQRHIAAGPSRGSACPPNGGWGGVAAWDIAWNPWRVCGRTLRIRACRYSWETGEPVPLYVSKSPTNREPSLHPACFGGYERHLFAHHTPVRQTNYSFF